MQPLGRGLGGLGLTPNMLTTMSLLISCLAGLTYMFRFPFFGALGLVASGFVDMLDGAVARAAGRATRFGAVFDHVLDRYAELAILMGIGLGGFADWLWIIFCLFGMVMASYARAKAESVGGLKHCTVGIAERQEKMILLLAGSLLQPFFSIALAVSAIVIGLLSHVTVVQRLHYTFTQTRGSSVDI